MCDFIRPQHVSVQSSYGWNACAHIAIVCPAIPYCPTPPATITACWGPRSVHGGSQLIPKCAPFCYLMCLENWRAPRSTTLFFSLHNLTQDLRPFLGQKYNGQNFQKHAAQRNLTRQRARRHSGGRRRRRRDSSMESLYNKALRLPATDQLHGEIPPSLNHARA